MTVGASKDRRLARTRTEAGLQEIEVASLVRLQDMPIEYPAVTAPEMWLRGVQAARRSARSSYGTSISIRRAATSTDITSPVLTNASGPPTEASGAT